MYAYVTVMKMLLGGRQELSRGTVLPLSGLARLAELPPTKYLITLLLWKFGVQLMKACVVVAP